MRKSIIAGIVGIIILRGIILIGIILIGIIFISSYNGLVGSHAEVSEKSANLETMLQRRYDLIPNVVEAVKGQMSHEEKVFTEIANARAKIGNSNNQEDKNNAQGELSSAISRLLVLTENYPELKTNEQVNSLIVELEGTENRIQVARTDYNKVANNYNVKIRRFPTNIFANIFGFEKVELFKSESAAQSAPKVNFGR